jgi:hypothetical protein
MDIYGKIPVIAYSVFANLLNECGYIHFVVRNSFSALPAYSAYILYIRLHLQ